MQERPFKYNDIPTDPCNDLRFFSSSKTSQQKREVRIQDILLMSEKGEYNGISSQNMESSENPVPRMIALITTFAKRVKKNHIANDRPTLTYELITRLVLNEFSLYTKDKPLSLEQYKELIAATNTIAKTLPPNIHLVIATFPVLWPDGLLHNVGLYVQSPKNKKTKPILHHFDKRAPHLFDLKYLKSKRSTYWRETFLFYGNRRTEDKALDDYYGTPLSPDKLLSDTAVSVNDIHQYRGAIIVKTASGKRILVSLEICREHAEKTSIADTNFLTYQLRKNNKTLPKRASQVIISHHIRTVEENLITDSFAHADTNVLNSYTLRIKNPGFGSDWRLAVNPPVPLGILKGENLHRPTEFTPSLFTEIAVETLAKQKFKGKGVSNTAE